MMWGAIFRCIRRVLADGFSALGVISTGLGVLSGLLEKTLILPAWAWIVLGAILIFVTACRLEWELEKERDNRKPESDTTLEDVVRRMRGVLEPFDREMGDPAEILRHLDEIREKALQGHLATFGREGVEIKNQKPLAPIRTDYWDRNKIDYMFFWKDRRGATEKTGARNDDPRYCDLHFDRRQIDKRWPLPRRQVRLRNPLQIMKGKPG
jgi:hypothetical protein